MLLLFLIKPLQAQDGIIDGPILAPGRPDHGWSGVIQVDVGVETPIYVVRLEDQNAVPFGQTPYLGNPGVIPPAIPGINIKIRDLAASTGLATTDFTGLNIYQSDNLTWGPEDGAAMNLGPVPVAAVGVGMSFPAGLDNTTLSVTHIGIGVGSLREIPLAGTYYIITAVISPNAVPGHSFTVQTDDTHVGFLEAFGAGHHNDGPGRRLVYDGARYIVIAAQTAQYLDPSAGRSIPFGGEAAILVLLLGTGLYMIRRHYSSK